jgi:diguanylate cyclase (GGDEF)-like protein
VSGPTFLGAIKDRRALCEVLADEPGIAVSPVAVAAVPAIASGRMIGMIVVVRSADEPFGNPELEALNLLAPVAGSALANAEPANQDEIDSLTRLANRRRMDRDFIDLTRDGQVGIASIQIDRFARLTEHHGSAATDELLRQIALTVTANIRPSDVAYRSGDAEFVILLPQTEKKEAAWVAERVRQAITAVTIHGLAQSEHATASIGVTAGDHDDPQELAERARSAMFEAEELGANRVVLDGAV